MILTCSPPRPICLHEHCRIVTKVVIGSIEWWRHEDGGRLKQYIVKIPLLTGATTMGFEGIFGLIQQIYNKDMSRLSYKE